MCSFRDFIESQKVFFVATAAPEGRVNVCRERHGYLRVVGPNRIVWLNLTGSENETAAHLVESPRMTLMWCSFEARTLVLRVYGNAKVFHPRANEWPDLISLFPPLPGARQVLDVDVDLVVTSRRVPLFDYVGQRETLQRWGEKKGPEGVHEFWENRISSASMTNQLTYSQHIKNDPIDLPRAQSATSARAPRQMGLSVRIIQEGPMRLSTQRFLTTHTGSLPRPDDLDSCDACQGPTCRWTLVARWALTAVSKPRGVGKPARSAIKTLAPSKIARNSHRARFCLRCEDDQVTANLHRKLHPDRSMACRLALRMDSGGWPNVRSDGTGRG